MIIYSKDGLIERYDAKKFSYNGTFLGEAYITTTITSEIPIAFQIGDYCEYRGERFELNNIPTAEKVSSSGSYGEAFKYEDLKLKFLGYELSNCAFLDYVTSDNGVHYSGLSDFSFTGTVSNLAERIKANLDRIYTGNKAWAITIDPTVGDATETVSSQNITCFEALALVSTIFDVNFIIRNRTITIGAVGIDAGTTFGYGKGNGIKSLIANVDNDSNIITRLRVFGNTTNIPYRWYNKQINPSTGLPYISESMYVPNLVLPDFLTRGGDTYIDSTTTFDSYSGGEAETVSFTYNFDGGDVNPVPITTILDAGEAEGSVSYIDLYGIREGSVFFDGSDDNDDIYPTIIDMTADQLIAAGIPITLEIGDDGNLDELHSVVNPTDNGILPDDGTELSGTFTLVLKDLGFDLSEKDSDGEYLYASSDGDMTISMKSGNCAARDFIIIEDGITKETNSGVITYKLVCNRDQDDDIGMAFPNTSYPILSGDKFVITNIQMPDVYVYAAMQKLLAAGTTYLNENNKPKYSYEPTIDNIYMAEHPLIGYGLKEGDTMTFEDLDLPVSKTIIISNLEIKEGESLIPQYSITLNNDVAVSTIQQIKNSVSETQLVVGENKKSILKYTNRSLADVKETAKALSTAFENYSEGISPAYIETLSLVAGDESGQFMFVNEYSSSAVTIGYGFIWDNSTGVLSSVTDKYLKHMTLGIDELTSSSYVRSYTDYRFWSLSNTSFTIVDDTLKYIYAKCGVATSTGTYIVSEIPYIWDADASFYYFLVGVLNSQKDGSRSYSEVYGYTEILPGRITTEKIISSNGENFFDLGSNKFNVGNDNNYINWNDKVANGLRIKGAIVQSQSGDTSVLPVYRGTYNSTTPYYNGDTVTYNGSTWQYINGTAGQGHTPSDNEYWDIVASAGAIGATGQIVFKSTVFIRSNTDQSAPTGGTFASPVPSGWYDGIPTGTAKVWMSTRIFTSDGLTPQQSVWTTPATLTNTSDFEVEYSVDGNTWVSTSSDATIYMRTRAAENGVFSSWTVSKIKGETGDDGVGISSVVEYYLATSASTGVTTSTSGWTTSVQSITSTNKYLWNYEKVTYSDASIVDSSPVIIGVYGNTGVGISSITEHYLATSASSGITTGTSGWTTNIQTVTSTNKYLWNYETINYTDSTTSNTAPVVIGVYGDTGSVGTSVSSIIEEYYLSTSKKAQVGGSWVTTPPTWISGQYIWTRSKITYSNPASIAYTTPIVSSEWEAVNAVQVGGRNYAINSGGEYTTQVFVDASSNCPLKAGEQLTLSAEGYGYAELRLYANGGNGFEGIPVLVFTGSSYEKKSATFNIPSLDGGGLPMSRFSLYINFPHVGFIKKIKLESGNKATDWTVAPEDTQSQIDETITDVDVEYYLSTSSTVLSGGSWVTTAPIWVDGKYMWSRTKTTQSDGTITYTPSEGGTCIAGATGATGKGISSTAIAYQLSASGTTAPTGTWLSSIPSVPAGQYLWTRTIITYTDSTTSTSYTVGMMGETGATGADGTDGTNGVGISATTITYQSSSSGTVAPTGTWTSTIPSISASQYLWTRTIWTYTDATTATGYSVGMMGATGNTGSTGNYFEHRYAVNGSPTVAPSIVLTDASPSGWSTTLPTQGLLQYTWITTAQKNYAGTLIANWSTPQRLTGVHGDVGPAQSYKGNWNSSTVYYGGSLLVNVVYYTTNSTYYIARVDAGSIPAGTLPTNTTYWNSMGASFESVATGILLAQSAYIENLIVSQLATSSNPYASRFANVGTGIGVFKNLEDQASIDNALVAIGKDISIMQQAGDRKPALVVRDKQWRGTYSSTTIYYKDDRVYYSTNAGATTYSSSTAYSVGSYVTYNSTVWRCILANTGNTPGIGSSYWTQDGYTYLFYHQWLETEKPAPNIPTSNSTYWSVLGSGNLGGGSYSEVGSEGLFANGSNIMGFAASTGSITNCSLVSLLQKRNSQANGISTAILGVDQTDSSDGASKSYGGYFTRLYVAGLYKNIRNVKTSQTLLKTDCTIHCYNTSTITLTLPVPDNAMVGMEITIRKLDTQTVIISTSSLYPIWNTASVTSIKLENDDALTFIWDGNYWVTYYMNN